MILTFLSINEEPREKHEVRKATGNIPEEEVLLKTRKSGRP